MTTRHESPHEDPGRWSPRRKAVLGLVLWPLVITVAGVLFYLTFMSELPEQVATHWSRRGPDGFTARESVPWLTLIGLVTAWLTGAVILAVGGSDGRHRRLTVGFAAGLAAFGVGVVVGTTWPQRGLSDGALARDVEWPLVVALLGSIVIGVMAAFTVPGHDEDATRATGRIPQDATRAELGADQRAAWSAVAVPSRWFWVLMAFVTLTMVLTAWLTGMWVFSLLMLAGLALVVLAVSVFRITVGEAGMVVVGVLGFPRWRLPLEDVAVARSTAVDPLTEFGGWGYRLGVHGRTGFVVRKGEALEVERGDGTSWVVTVDDAERAAGLLNTLAERAR